MTNLIIEMEMPTRCAECDIVQKTKSGYRCPIASKMHGFSCVVGRGQFDLPHYCPIHGVLPDEHGDLIDRDKFVDKYIRHYTEQERKMNLVFAAVEVKQDFADMIYEEDAVIAAERKDDGDKISV